MAGHYDDPTYDYQFYWQGREYEHQSEVLAIKKLLQNKYFKNQADIGGGFGRLYPTFVAFSKKVTLLEPSKKLRDLAKKSYPDLIVRHATSDKIPFRKNTFDFISMIRVSHHLPNLAKTFSEIHRVLKPDGYYLLEVANSANFKTRLLHLFTPLPKVPIEKRSPANIRRQTIAFVNHHPDTVLSLLEKHGFIVEQILSVSNFRSPFLKSIIPLKVLLFLESAFCHLLSGIYYGPSLFILTRKIN